MKQIAFGVHMPVMGFSSGEKDFQENKSFHLHKRLNSLDMIR
jgi:hypothetical protein